MNQPRFVKTNLFATEEREQRRDNKCDLLAVLEKHASLEMLSAEVNRIAPRPINTKDGRPTMHSNWWFVF